MSRRSKPAPLPPNPTAEEARNYRGSMRLYQDDMADATQQGELNQHGAEHRANLRQSGADFRARNQSRGGRSR